MAMDDFDFDGTFTDDDDEEGQDVEELEDDEADDEEQPKRSNPIRLILLVLLVVVLLCVVCGFAGSRGVLPFDIPGLGGGDTDTAPAPPAQDTVTPVADGGAAPATEEPAPSDDGSTSPTDDPTATATDVVSEQPATTEPVATVGGEETQPTAEPTEEPTDAAEPTDAPSEEPTEEPEPTATTAPVPGPTATPGPTVAITVVAGCENNVGPTADADGSYSAMKGKGPAVVNFDAGESTDADGTIVSYEWDFGDGSTGTGQTTSHGYEETGLFIVTLTVTDNCGATDQDASDVTITGATPPADGGDGDTPAATATATPAATSMPSADGTAGFCYRVRYGDSLSGLAWRYNVTLAELATVNDVDMNYMVLAGQGLFVPTESVVEGSNLYHVEAGDTLNNVAYRCGITAQTLAQANGLNVNDGLSPGQSLVVPIWQP